MIPPKVKLIEIPESLKQSILPPMARSVKNSQQDRNSISGLTPLKGRNMRHRAQHSV